MNNCKLEQINDNTNSYNNSTNVIFKTGEKILKEKSLNYFDKEIKDLYKKNKIYLHDSEFFDITINCASISLEKIFKKNLIINNIFLKKPENIFELFSQINIFLINLENEISGGLTFINFDYELEKIIRTLNIQFPDKEVLYGLIQNLFQNINFANSIYEKQSPYIYFTIGIVENKKQALITEIILEVLKKGNNNKPYIFPNIHFRVKNGINANKKAPYYYLLEKSIETTSYQMNPTYLLCDSDKNKNRKSLYIHTVRYRSRLLETKNDNDENWFCFIQLI